MKPINLAFFIFIIVSFISGIYFCSTQNAYFVEKFTDNPSDNPSDKPSDNSSAKNNDTCPDLLIKSGNAILLYNSKLPESPGTNPLPFYNLDEYINYLEIQKRNGTHCPVLFLQEEVNTQGNSVYRIRPDIFQPQGGLSTAPQLYYTNTPIIPRKPIPVIDANQDNPPYNSGGYNDFDPYGQHIGEYTVIDSIHDSTFKGKSLSENPMDDNWGGVIYTKNAVDSGKYKENEVAPPSMGGPFTEKSDNIHNDVNNTRNSIYD